MTTATVHRYPLARAQAPARAFPLDYGTAIALTAGLLFAIAGTVTMLLSMPDGLRGSFIGAAFAAVGVLLVGVAASIQTEIAQEKETR
jgi:hypothetical protein